VGVEFVIKKNKIKKIKTKSEELALGIGK